MPIHRWWVIQQKNIAELQPQECPHGKDITMDEQVKEHRGFIGNSLGDGPQPVGEQTGEKIESSSPRSRLNWKLKFVHLHVPCPKFGIYKKTKHLGSMLPPRVRVVFVPSFIPFVSTFWPRLCGFWASRRDPQHWAHLGREVTFISLFFWRICQFDIIRKQFQIWFQVSQSYIYILIC